jgi:hypothetical protein
MSRVFHSKIFGCVNKRRRRQLGFAGRRREDVWRLMAEQEAKLTAVARLAAYRRLPWWRRLWARLRALCARIWSRLVRER